MKTVMEMTNRSPYRVYLVLDPLRRVLPRLGQMLAPLADVDPYLPGVEAFYDDCSGAALLGLKFNRRAAERIGHNPLIELVAECKLPVIAPEELGESEYVAFFSQHLPMYPVHVSRERSAADARPLVEQVITELTERAARTLGGSATSEFNLTPQPTIKPQARSHSPALDKVRAAATPPPQPKRASSRWELDLDLD
ncbi:MAG: hypothetical protein AAGC55_13670, partial [Myxococcota bacterium]